MILVTNSVVLQVNHKLSRYLLTAGHHASCLNFGCLCIVTMWYQRVRIRKPDGVQDKPRQYTYYRFFSSIISSKWRALYWQLLKVFCDKRPKKPTKKRDTQETLLHECFTWAAEQVLRSADAFACTCRGIKGTWPSTGQYTWVFQQQTGTTGRTKSIYHNRCELQGYCVVVGYTLPHRTEGEVSERKCQGSRERQWVQPQCKRLFSYNHPDYGHPVKL